MIQYQWLFSDDYDSTYYMPEHCLSIRCHLYKEDWIGSCWDPFYFDTINCETPEALLASLIKEFQGSAMLANRIQFELKYGD